MIGRHTETSSCHQVSTYTIYVPVQRERRSTAYRSTYRWPQQQWRPHTPRQQWRVSPGSSSSSSSHGTNHHHHDSENSGRASVGTSILRSWCGKTIRLVVEIMRVFPFVCSWFLWRTYLFVVIAYEGIVLWFVSVWKKKKVNFVQVQLYNVRCIMQSFLSEINLGNGCTFTTDSYCNHSNLNQSSGNCHRWHSIFWHRCERNHPQP